MLQNLEVRKTLNQLQIDYRKTLKADEDETLKYQIDKMIFTRLLALSEQIKQLIIRQYFLCAEEDGIRTVGGADTLPQINPYTDELISLFKKIDPQDYEDSRLAEFIGFIMDDVANLISKRKASIYTRELRERYEHNTLSCSPRKLNSGQDSSVCNEL